MVFDRPAWRRRGAVTLLFLVLAAVMTWPQVTVLGTHAEQHQDVFFNLWRLRWIAHALATAPASLFNGNQFYPELRVLAFSDALLVEGLIGAPLLWLRVPPVLVHNLLLLGAIVASGTGMFTLARHLSGSTAGGVLAGIVFAFAPYRFDHYMHMELQWAVWSPWAFWALQRTFETRAWRFGALTGVFIALQMTSSVYYGIFLAVLIATVGGIQLIFAGRERLPRLIAVLALGAAIAGGVSAAYSVPYSRAAARVGERGQHEITMFSARPRDFRKAMPDNLIYGTKYSAPERRLFPGLLPLVLALGGLLLVRPGTIVVSYLVGLVLALELSLGMYGQLYPVLHAHVGVFHGLRAPARAAIFCLLFLGVLAAWGLAAVESALTGRRRLVAGVAACAVLLLEYWTAPLKLIRYDNTPPPLYAFLAQQPRGVVAEFPIPRADALPGEEPRYVYMSTFHWMPLINGYSGYYPPVYLHRLPPLSTFPDTNSLRWLRHSQVRYVIVHSGGYEIDQRTAIVETLLRDPFVVHLGDFDDGWGAGALFRLE